MGPGSGNVQPSYLRQVMTVPGHSQPPSPDGIHLFLEGRAPASSLKTPSVVVAGGGDGQVGQFVPGK